MKRSRYTATLQKQGEGVTRKVILCYSARDAHLHYEARGYVVLKIAKGDYRKTGRSPVAAPPGQGGGYNYNLPAIRAAFKAKCGYDLPPITFAWGKRTQNGTQRGVFSVRNGALTVRVRPDLTPAQANRTLWHELAHVMQFCRTGHDPAAWSAANRAERRARHGYLNRPIEREARSWEPEADRTWLLNGARR